MTPSCPSRMCSEHLHSYQQFLMSGSFVFFFCNAKEYLFIYGSIQSFRHIRSLIYSTLSNANRGEMPGASSNDANLCPCRMYFATCGHKPHLGSSAPSTRKASSNSCFPRESRSKYLFSSLAWVSWKGTECNSVLHFVCISFLLEHSVPICVTNAGLRAVLQITLKWAAAADFPQLFSLHIAECEAEGKERREERITLSSVV